MVFLTETLSWTDSNPGKERHGCFRLSTSTMELVDVSMAEVLVAWSALGECSLELLEVLSISDGMMIDDLGAALVTWNDLL